MLKKLFLDQTKKYEQLVAMEEIADMLVNFVLGRKHHIGIGAEQGEIEAWDDFVYEEYNHTLVHLQVKKQQTNFSDFSCKKEQIKNKDLSTLDKCMKSLAKWIKESGSDPEPVRKFILELPAQDNKIKNDLSVRQLNDFKTLHIVQTTNASGLLNLQNNQRDQNTINIFDWLTNWCEFDDWDHILQAFKNLTIKFVGIESNLLDNTERKLKLIFIDEKEVFKKIRSYITDNTAYTATIKPRQLLFELKDYLHHDIKTWTLFEKLSTQWNISGIHDLQLNTEIERSNIIVPKLWSNEAKRSLIINSSINDNCKLSEGLMRLAIHQDGLTNTSFSDKNAWKCTLKYKIGDTLGNGTDDFNNLNFNQNNEKFQTSEYKTLLTIADQELIANELNESMYKYTWDLIKVRLNNKILSMNSSELKDAVDSLWRKWQQELDISSDKLQNLLSSMLHPAAEGDEIIGYIRVGTKTVTLLTEGFFLLLVISVSLDGENGNWEKLSSGLLLNIISLKYWSGSAGKKRKVKMISEDFELLVGKEQADILIMPNVENSPSELMKLSIVKAPINENTLANGKQLDFLVTNDLLIKHYINEGDIKQIKDHIESTLSKNKELKQKDVNEIIQ